MKLILFSLVSVGCALLLGCGEIPVARTYSIEGGYGEAHGSVSVRLEPPAKKADPKLMREPVTSIDIRRERVVPVLTAEGAEPLAVTRLP